MEITITVSMDNAAFGDDPQAELTRILEQVAFARADGKTSLRDLNGNAVGHYVVVS